MKNHRGKFRRNEMFVEAKLCAGFRPVRDEIMFEAKAFTNIESLTGFLKNDHSIHQSLTDESKNTAKPISQSMTDRLQQFVEQQLKDL